MNVLISTRTTTSNNGFEFDAFERGFHSMFKGHNITALLNDPKQDGMKLAGNNDLLVLSGGNDHTDRLLVEIEMVKHFRLQNKPILGICHGAFLVTQLMDGQCIDIEGHRKITHPVWYRDKEIVVNSYHGSTVSEVPPGAISLCKDKDGNIEAWYNKDKKTMAIIWHPERDPKHWLPDEYQDLLSIKGETQ
tara:strand:+ start:4054 stop:4626 length:573 start_codon:yes stop_codon:yes gene_type:complete